jgi:hypothetical protein
MRGMVISAEMKLQCVITDRPGVEVRFFYILRSVDCCWTQIAQILKVHEVRRILLMVVGPTFLISRIRT